MSSIGTRGGDVARGRPRHRGVALAAALLVAAAFVLAYRKDPILIPLAAVLAAMAAVAVRWPLFGLAGLTLMLVSNLSQALISGFGLPSTAKLALPGLVALLALRYLLHGERPYVPWAFGALSAAFVAVQLVAASGALHWQVAFGLVEEHVKDVAVVLVGLAFLHHRGAFESVVDTVLVTLAALCTLGAVQYVGGEMFGEFRGFSQIHDGNGRFSGPIGDPNFFGAILAFGIPLGVHRFYDARGPRLLAWGAVLALLLFGLAATQSRGGMIAMLIGVAVLLPFLSRVQVSVTLLIGVLAVMAVATTLDQAQLDRLSGVFDAVAAEGGVDRATEGRLASWQVAWKLFAENPLLGVGPGNFNPYYQDTALELGLIFRGEDRSAHSLYLELLAEIGLVGLGAFLLILIAAGLSVARAVRIARDRGEPRLARHYAAFGAGLAAYLTAMVFLHDSYPRFLLLTIGLGVELSRHARLRAPAAVSPDGPARPPGLAAPA